MNQATENLLKQVLPSAGEIVDAIEKAAQLVDNCYLVVSGVVVEAARRGLASSRAVADEMARRGWRRSPNRDEWVKVP